MRTTVKQRGVQGAILVGIALIATPALAPAGAAWPNPNAKIIPTEDGRPEILLTFDDGPDHKNTPKVLDTLRERNVQAIFFSTGYLVGHRSKRRTKRVAMLNRIVSEGHLVGNHTINHAHLCEVSAEKATTEIDETTKLFEKLTRMPVFLFRSPYGNRCPRLEKMLKARNMEHTHWDIDPREWRNSTTAATYDAVTSKLRYLKGRAIILMHDTKITTVRSLPKILDWIDNENVSRRKAGKKTIRILNASEWIAMNWDVRLWTAAEAASSSATSRLRASIDRLVPGAKLTKSAATGPL